MTLANGDLTTLADCKAYMPSPPSDAVLTGLITRISRQLLTAMNRPVILPKAYTEQFNGTGTQSLVLPNWPLLSLTSLVVSGTTFSLAPQIGETDVASNPWGYRFQPWDGAPPGFPATVELIGGGSYCYGGQNVVATYLAGYQVSSEAVAGSGLSGAVYTPSTPYGIWATDRGVVYTTAGTALTAVAGPTPSVGQYVAPTPNAAIPVLTYTFNATDIATGLSISYGYVPADLEQAAIEQIMERSSYRSRVGEKSRSLASQETIAFNLGGLSAEVQALIQPYVSVLPPAMGANV